MAVVADARGTIAGPDYEVEYRVYGRGAPALICINGAQQTTSSWRSLIAHIGQHFRVITFDFPGQGRSTFHGQRHGLDFNEQVEVVARVADACAACHAAVFGASWGSLIAAGYASRHAERVHRLILASFALRPTTALLELIDRGQDFVRNDRQDALGPMIIEGFGGMLPEKVKRMIIAQFRLQTVRQAHAFLEHSRLVVSIEDAHKLVDLRAIRAETLLINGEQDRLVDPADLALAQTLIPTCTTRLVPDTGHFLHLERASILDEYLTFLLSPRTEGGQRTNCQLAS